MEVPLPVAGKAREVHAALEEVFGVLRDLGCFLREVRERVLESVIDLGEHTRPELGREELARELDGVVDHEVGRRVEHLHVAARAAHADDFRHQALVAKDGVTDFVLGHGAVEGDGDHVAVDRYDFTCRCHKSW